MIAEINRFLKNFFIRKYIEDKNNGDLSSYKYKKSQKMQEEMG
jgi:hypothetical protein